jgi:hypothetical protein
LERGGGESNPTQKSPRGYTGGARRVKSEIFVRFVRNEKAAVLGISLLSILLSIALSGLYFKFSYFEPDTVSYLFQAKLFAQGRIAADAPPDFGFSPSPHINIVNGKWYSKYPFGNALALSLGVLAGAPWFIPALATGAALLLLHRILREVYDSQVALVGSLLALISPSVLVMGAVWCSEAVSRLFVALFLLALIRTVEVGGRFYPMVAGFALGYVLNTTPLTALAVGLSGAGFWLYSLMRGRRKQKLLRCAAIFLLPLGFMVGLYLGWNHYLTGSPWQSTHNATQPYDRLGFGPRAEGHVIDARQEYTFTPMHALRRVLTRTIPAVSFNSFGWGYYHPRMNRWLLSWSGTSRLQLLLRVLPLSIPLALMILPILHPSRNRYDVLFLCFILLTLCAYFFFYWGGSTFGFTPAHTRYYSQCTMFGMLPLVARAIQIVYRRLRRVSGTLGLRIAGLAIALLLLNTLHSYTRYAEQFRSTGEFYWRLQDLVEDRNLHKAVVFVSGEIHAPIGDYPFRDLQDADIVYYRLASFKRWKLTQTDWRTVYSRYFKERRPYLFKDRRLVPLKVD